MADPQKLSGQTVTMFAPDGNTGEVPAENSRAAMQAGAKLAVWMKAPDGSIGMVPHDQVAAAQKGGGTVAEPPEGYSTAWQEFKKTMPGFSDIVRAAGIPTSRDELNAMGQAEANKSAGQKAKDALMSGLPGARILPSMGKELYRGVKGVFGTPEEQIEAPIHLLSGANPFSAPVTDAMTQQGLGTPQSNATGVVGAGTLAAGALAPKLAPPLTRTAVRVANKALSPAAVGAAGGSLGGPVGAAAGAEVLPELFPGWAARAQQGLIPTPAWAAKPTPQMMLFRNTPKLGNSPLAVENPALPQEMPPAAKPSADQLLQNVKDAIDKRFGKQDWDTNAPKPAETQNILDLLSKSILQAKKPKLTK